MIVTPPVEIATIVVGLPSDETALVERAAEYALEQYGDARLSTGEPSAAHAFAMAAELANLRLDGATRAAGLLYRIPQHVADHRVVLGERFGEEIVALVASVAKLHELRLVTREVSAQDRRGDRSAQAEVLRKMLLAMVEDIRSVLIRLASRAQTLRFLVDAPDAVKRPIAQETLDIFAPLANRLGVWQLKWALEDLAFRFLEPAIHDRISALLAEQRDAREAFIERAMDTLKAELAAAGVQGSLSGRSKQIYSIYQKMLSKGREFDQLYDVRAVRVMVEDVRDCYTALGVVHNLWQPIPKEFDDYISRPKANGYRSLHTAVTMADGGSLEVQIRTHEMHRQAELGVAAHWRYKEGGARATGASYDEKIAWLRQVLAWRDEVVDGADWVEQFKKAALDDTVYVLTPQGRVLDLPKGATPVDFAYSLHTDLGHRCRGAKVNGAMVPLDRPLANGERVEIITVKQGGPSRDWLNAELGYLASNRARNKVRQFFNHIEYEETVASGRATVERELQREGRTGENLEALAGRLGFAKPELLFQAVGRDEVNHRQLQIGIRDEVAPPPVDEARIGRAHSIPEKSNAGILVSGVDRLLTQLAKCCRPVPPDAIRGFVTRGRGVSIHRAECKSFRALLAAQPERAIDADWGLRGGASVYPVDLIVQANDRQGLLRDISDVFVRDRINVIGVNTASRRGIATMQFTAEVNDAAQLAHALTAVREVRGVFSASRL